MEKHETNYKPIVHLRLGASLVKFKPLLSRDTKSLFCCCGHVVRVVSTGSGQCVRELRGHTDLVTSVKFNPRNTLQVFTASLDQTVRQWDYTDGVQLKVYNVHFPVHVALVPGFEDGAILAVRQCKEKSYDLVRLALSLKSATPSKPSVILQEVNCQEKHIALGVQNQYLAAITGMKLTVHHFRQNRNYEHWCGVDRTRRFTCIACHPTEMCIATGCSDGVIFLWYNFMGHKKPVKTINHWHALPVGDLTFTAEGSYLLSGGHECVLVKWQLNSQHKDFLPRLGAPIDHVTCAQDNSLYVTCHTDNALHLISNTLRLQQVVQGLNRGHCDRQVANPLPAGLLFDPRSKAMVLNGKPGHLQFYSMYSDRQLYNLDIVQQNYISAENIKRPLVFTEVECAAFSEDGTWLATVERRDDGLTSVESKLKFWLFDSTSQAYTLNTNVDMPHADKVNSIKFRPINSELPDEPLMAVTSGGDGKFKLWTVVDDTDIYRSNQCWSCDSVGYYRDKPAGCAAFSEDGSILAVVFGSVVTLWDPDSNALKTTLRHHPEDVKLAVFGCNVCSHILVTSSSDHLTAWNLLSCSVMWSLSLNVEVLVVDNITSHLAVFTTDLELIVYSPSSPDAFYKQSFISQKPVIAAIFIPHEAPVSRDKSDPLAWQSDSQLYYMNNRQQLLTITREEELANYDPISVEQHLPQTPFSLLLTKKQKLIVGNDTDKDEQIGRPGSAAVSKLLSTPAHVLPPATTLCNTFLKSLLVKKSSGNGQVEEEDDDDDDENDLSSSKDDDMKSNDSDSDTEVEHEPTSSEQKTKLEERTQTETTRDNVDLLVAEDFSFISSMFS